MKYFIILALAAIIGIGVKAASNRYNLEKRKLDEVKKEEFRMENVRRRIEISTHPGETEFTARDGSHVIVMGEEPNLGWIVMKDNHLRALSNGTPVVLEIRQ